MAACTLLRRTLVVAGIMGNFPFAAQRLTRKDLRRYISEHHPEYLASLDARCDYLFAGKAPTVTEWIDAAERNGLKVIAMERIMAKKHHRLPYTMGNMLQQPWFSLSDLMLDIRCFRPDVSVDDLLTSIIACAMVKV